jgi:polyisoprenoid-binding protein YceI
MRTLLLLVATAALVPQAPAGPSTWQVDPGHTSAQFSAKHMLVSTVRGTLGKVTGTIEYDAKSVESIQADVTIEVAGLSTANEGRDKDLRSPNFFDVEKYPTISFKSTRAERVGAGRFRLAGALTIHGVTKEVTLDCDGPSPILKTPQGQRVGASASLTINRRDFGLQYSKMIEAAPIVSDQIEIRIDIEATKK